MLGVLDYPTQYDIIGVLYLRSRAVAEPGEAHANQVRAEVPMSKKAPRNETVGSRIIAGLTELVEAVERGERIEKRFTVRTVELDLEPQPYDAASVKATRSSLGVSQAVFARILGATVECVQSWEQGVRRPHPMACRLLDEVNRNRKYWLQRLRLAAKQRVTAAK